METKYVDFLIVKRQDDNLAVVVAPFCKAELESLVEFNGGEIGKVALRTWGHASDIDSGDLADVSVPVYEAEAVYPLGWKKGPDE